MHPKILPNEKYKFAKPHSDLIKVYKKILLETDIEFDLIYDSVGWKILMNNFKQLNSSPILYIHSGGILGNKTQLLRYKKM